MLNEKLEYQEYLFSYYNKDFEKYRIITRNLNNGLTGVPRALEIIARHELFDNNLKPFKTAEAMVDWLDDLYNSSFVNGDKNCPKIKARITNFKNTRFAVRDKDGTLKTSISDRIKKCINKKEKNDLQKSTWDRVIANALEKGKLREFALVEKIDPFEDNNIFKEIYKFDRGTKTSLNTPGTDAHKDYLRKFTAYYLLENTLNQKAVTLKESLLNNWSTIYVDGILYFYTLEKDNTSDFIFSKTMVNDSTNKFTPCEAWINNYDLIDITDEGALEKWLADPKNKGLHCYTDNGAFKLLERHEAH